MRLFPDFVSRFIYSDSETVAPFSMTFDLDPLASARRIPFKLERRTGESFSENLYYSFGPLKTKDHLTVLKMIEESLSVS